MTDNSVFLVVVGLDLLPLHHGPLSCMRLEQQEGAAVFVLVGEALPDLRHCEQHGPTISGWECVGDSRHCHAKRR
jgi:hypothetical protein